MSQVARYRREIRDRWLAVRLGLTGRQHQYQEIMALRRLVRHFGVDCIIDVGANAGQYATMLRDYVGFRGTILSFEPNPHVFAALERNAARDPQWHAYNIALSDSDGTATFNITVANQFGSLNQPHEGRDDLFVERARVTETVEVQTRRLDTLWAELASRHGARMPLLKLDTQGHDLSVCEGALGVLPLMTGVQTELAIRPIYAGGADYAAMIGWLAERGFAPNAIFANNKGHFPLLVEMDGLFVRTALLDGHG